MIRLAAWNQRRHFLAAAEQLRIILAVDQQ
jgi:hypothetical protein